MLENWVGSLGCATRGGAGVLRVVVFRLPHGTGYRYREAVVRLPWLGALLISGLCLVGCGEGDADPSDSDDEKSESQENEESGDGQGDSPSELPEDEDDAGTPKDDDSDGGSSDPKSEEPDSEKPESSPGDDSSPEGDKPEGEKPDKDKPKGKGPAGTCGEGGKIGSIEKISLEGAGDRHYFVGAPKKEGPLPLVIAFHGDEGSPNAVKSFWTPVWRKEQSFILVMTQCPGCKSWYKGDTKANAQYLWDVLEDVSDNYNVDVSRVYGIGYSGGSVFLALHGFEFQNVFAAIQWHCGGGRGYAKPPRDDCKVAGRIVIAKDDFLWDSAKTVEKNLKSNGHEVDFVEAECSGHCCHTKDLAVGAWAWMKGKTKCGGEVGGQCAEITDLP